jgi:hypothetical protein
LSSTIDFTTALSSSCSDSDHRTIIKFKTHFRQVSKSRVVGEDLHDPCEGFLRYLQQGDAARMFLLFTPLHANGASNDVHRHVPRLCRAWLRITLS